VPSSKSNSKPKRNRQCAFEAIGTYWVIEYEGAKNANLEADILKRIETFDKTYSRFRGDSLVTRMGRAAGTYKLPPDARGLLQVYRQLYDATNGAVTPLIGDVLSDAGYDATYSLTPKRLTPPPAWDDVLTIYGTSITLARPTLLDFGAAGKGYLVDIITTTIKKYGIKTFWVDAGGDIRHENAYGNLLRVGLEHPDNPRQVIGAAELDNRSLCGSAGNRRVWANYHHIIDPRTLTSPSVIKATWVVANTAILADGLATCLFFVAPEALDRFHFEYCIVHADNSLTYSPAFPATLFVR
jgi:thiamine biosynthesis lipoprotein